MGAVPKKKSPRSRSNRRANAKTKALKMPNLVKCPSCGSLKRTHEACPSCGKYK